MSVGTRYRMRPELRQAIGSLPDLLDAFTLPYEKIQETFDGKKKALIVEKPIPDKTNDWIPKTFENHLLYKYWQKAGGLIYAEVEVGNKKRNPFWKKGAKCRYFDGVRHFFKNKSEFSERVADQPIELIEIKKKLNRPVIGQIVAGYDMFRQDYKSGKITNVIICSKGDPALEWVCENHSIIVKKIKLDNFGTVSG